MARHKKGAQQANPADFVVPRVSATIGASVRARWMTWHPTGWKSKIGFIGLPSFVPNVVWND